MTYTIGIDVGGTKVLGGKNVAPAVLEDRLRSHPLVSQCMVVGDNQPFIAALVTIDPDALKAWVVNNKKDGASINDLINDPDLIAVVQTAVDEANKAVSKAESIRKFTILPVDFTIAIGVVILLRPGRGLWKSMSQWKSPGLQGPGRFHHEVLERVLPADHSFSK